MFKRITKSLYGRLMQIVALACIPAIILGILVSFMSYRDHKKRISNGVQIICESNFSAVEKRLYELYVSLGRLVNNQYLSALNFGREGYETIENMKSLQDSLYTVRNENVFAEDVQVYLPSLNRVISASYGVYEIDEPYYEAVLENYRSGQRKPIQTIEDDLCMSVIYPYYNESDGNQFLILANLSKDEIIRCFQHSGDNPEYQEAITIDQIPLMPENEWVKKYDLLGTIQSDQLNISYNYYINPELFHFSGSPYIGLTLLIFVLTVGVILIAGRLLNRTVTQPIGKLSQAFSRMEMGDLDFSLDLDNQTIEFDYLFRAFNQTVKDMDQLLKDAYEDGKQLKIAEYKQLSYQIKPHFLFNCLHILNCMAKENDLKGIRNMTTHLSQYCKSLTGVSRVSTRLEEEYEMILNYANIQDIRFGSRITSDIQPLPQSLSQYQVPHLIIQPLIENVFAHGLKNKLENGYYRVSFTETENSFSAIVEDNGDYLDDNALEKLAANVKEPLGQGNLALINIDRRTKIMFGQEYGLQLSRSELGGLKAELRFGKKPERRPVA